MTARPGTILRGAMRDHRRALVAWTAAVAAVATMYTVFYPTIGATKFEVMLDAMPGFAEMMGIDAMVSAAGYVGMTVYSLLDVLLTLVCAITLGGRLIAGDEEAGVLELDFAAPVTRLRVYLERLAVLWLTVLALVASITVMLLILSWSMDLGLAVWNLIAASTGMLAYCGTLGMLAFGVGAATGRKAFGVGAATGVAVLGFLLNYLGPLIDAQWMLDWSPFSWYVADRPWMNGFDWVGIALLGGLALAAGGFGWWGFRRRDLMV
jgi:ABC-2 type transport system permease protein